MQVWTDAGCPPAETVTPSTRPRGLVDVCPWAAEAARADVVAAESYCVASCRSCRTGCGPVRKPPGARGRPAFPDRTARTSAPVGPRTSATQPRRKRTGEEGKIRRRPVLLARGPGVRVARRNGGSSGAHRVVGGAELGPRGPRAAYPWERPVGLASGSRDRGFSKGCPGWSLWSPQTAWVALARCSGRSGGVPGT